MAAFRQGLKEAGYIEGPERAGRGALGASELDRVPALADELIQHNVAVIVTVGRHQRRKSGQSGAHHHSRRLRARQRSGRGRPRRQHEPAGRQHHGRQLLTNVLIAKRLEILREIAPNAALIAVLVNPRNARANATRATCRRQRDCGWATSPSSCERARPTIWMQLLGPPRAGARCCWSPPTPFLPRVNNSLSYWRRGMAYPRSMDSASSWRRRPDQLRLECR